MTEEIKLHNDVKTRFDSMRGDVAAALMMGEKIVASRRLKHGGVIFEAGDVIASYGQYSGDWKMCQTGGARRYVATKTEYERSIAEHQRRQQRRDDKLSNAQEKYIDHQRGRAAGRVADLQQQVKDAKKGIAALKRKETAIRKSRDAVLKDAPQPYENDFKAYQRDVTRPANVELDQASSAVGKAQAALEPLQAALAEAQAELAAFD